VASRRVASASIARQTSAIGPSTGASGTAVASTTASGKAFPRSPALGRPRHVFPRKAGRGAASAFSGKCVRIAPPPVIACGKLRVEQPDGRPETPQAPPGDLANLRKVSARTSIYIVRTLPLRTVAPMRTRANRPLVRCHVRVARGRGLSARMRPSDGRSSELPGIVPGWAPRP
jgi:hypothetical protein